MQRMHSIHVNFSGCLDRWPTALMNITLAEEDLEEWTLGDFLGMFKTSFFFAVHMLSGIFRF